MDLPSHSEIMAFFGKARNCAADYPQDHPLWCPPMEPIISNSSLSPPSSPLYSLLSPHQQPPFADDLSFFHPLSNPSDSVNVGLGFEPESSVTQILSPFASPPIDATQVETKPFSHALNQGWDFLEMDQLYHHVFTADLLVPSSIPSTDPSCSYCQPFSVPDHTPSFGYRHHHPPVEGQRNGDNIDAASVYNCRICFGMAKQPVVTPCGHLFCWPCLCFWLHNLSSECPTCRSEILEHKIIPIYGGQSRRTCSL